MSTEKNPKCGTCKGELAIMIGDVHTRCPACYGTGDPECYGARVRDRMAEMETERLEGLLLDIIFRFYCGDSMAEVPLAESDAVNGGDLVSDMGDLLEEFHPETLAEEA